MALRVPAGLDVVPGLNFVSDRHPGIERRKRGKGFSYFHPTTGLIRNPEELDRIKRLAIPPAYTHVWISTDPNGHLQATGIDSRGRKQYLYHPHFRQIQDETKFNRMLEFGSSLPSIRAAVDHDLLGCGLPRTKLLAAVVYLLDKSLVRVGNVEYARANRSYGLTTMQTRHVKIAGADIRFSFLGKSKMHHRVEIHDRRLARLIKRLQDLPGQELFQYQNEDGTATTINSQDVNAYIREVGGANCSAKDFRTWWGSVLTLSELIVLGNPEGERAAAKEISRVIRATAEHLGNTASVCRKCYVHPAVIERYRAGTLPTLQDDDHECAEELFIDLLREEASKASGHHR